MNSLKHIEQKYWPAQKSAEHLGVSVQTLRNWAQQGKIDCLITPGRRYRYDVLGFIARAKAATDAKLRRDGMKLQARLDKDRERLRAMRLAPEPQKGAE